MFQRVLIISIFLLSSCGYHGCIKPQSVLFDEYLSAVEAGLENGKKEHVTWVKSDLILAGRKSLTIKVDTVNVNFCNNTKDTLQVSFDNKNAVHSRSDGNTSTKFPIKISNIMAGEKLNFSLSPAFKFTVNEDICKNKDPRVYVQNTDRCMKDYLGAEYHISIDNYGLQQMNNLMYLKDPKSIDEGKTWINFPLKILYHLDKSTYADLRRRTKNLKDKANSAKSSGNDDNYFDLCFTSGELDGYLNKIIKTAKSDENEQLILKQKELFAARQKMARKKYQKLYDAYTVNMICGNICGIPDYKNEKIDKNCFVVEKNTMLGKCFITRDSMCDLNEVGGQYSTVLPFVYLKHDSGITDFITIDDAIKKWQEDNNSSDIGLLTNHWYSFNKNLDKDLYLELRVGNNLELIGKYQIEVTKDCSNHVKDSLYYVISKGPPKVKPGDGGTKKLNFIDNESTTVQLTDDDVAGELYFGVKDNGDGYDNNTGYFNITVTAKKKIPNVISYIVEQLKNSLERGLYGTSSTNSGGVNVIYNTIKENIHFIQIVNSLLVLYILINALFYFVGFSKASIFELLAITLKIGIVIYVIGPNSWEFFNDHLFKLFTEAPIQLIAIMTGQDSINSTNFEFLDLMLYRFSLSETWLQILSLLFTGPVGWISVALIFWGLIVLFLTIATAVVTYLISIILIGLLLSIAPFFIICILFKRTKAIFDAWIKSLVQTAMQPVIIFASFALLTEVIDSIIYAMFNFELCDVCVLRPEFDIGITTISFCLLEFLLPLGFSPVSAFNDNLRDSVNSDTLIFIGLPMPIVNILIFVIMVNATKHFVGSSGEMCTSIFGSFANLSMVAENAKESALGIIGMDQNSRMQRARYAQMNNMNNQDNDGERRRDSLGFQLPLNDDSTSRPSRGGVSIPENPPSSFDG
ncbi:trbL/VirB6 plasmid conjugal transfer family protein [Ehrlichia japonica]|uniref:TrbL/VirB6 plasmid conjugal transfer family protein n=2 Tax=Ehrlichia japonica TaxID=391036 RepID=X5GID4_9RICK|nr:trbL/VirB6 plasmid conjugal transfer family protein [Ehrlichia japonica]